MDDGMGLERPPGFYTFKIFGRNSVTFVERVRQIIGEVMGRVPLDSVRVRESAHGRYLGVSIVVQVDDRAQLERAYAGLQAEPEVLLYI